MKIAIVGCGAMGSVYAGLLASAGNSLWIVDRWKAHVEAISSRGLRLEGPQRDLTAFAHASTTAPDEPMDLVIIAVKASDVETGARQALSMIGPETIVLTIQNGLGSAVAVGIASGFGASLKGPGHAHHNAMQALRFGAYSSLPYERVVTVARVWESA